MRTWASGGKPASGQEKRQPGEQQLGARPADLADETEWGHDPVLKIKRAAGMNSPATRSSLGFIRRES